MKRVKTIHRPPTTTARCDSCTNLPPSASRQRIRIHVRKNPGHVVTFEIKDITTYRWAGTQ